MRIVRSMFFMILLVGQGLSQWSSSRPDGHAPLGVMGDHTHEAGEFMLSYRFMYMNMEGNRNGTDRVDEADVVNPNGFDFRITPTNMPMQMHMFGLMYAPANSVTLMAMLPIINIEMDHLTRAGGQFTTESSGVGDVQVTALYVLGNFSNQRVHLNAGVSLPTGSIEQKDVTPASAPDEALLPYPMQTGSGTFDLLPGLTYLGQAEKWSWGAQAMAAIRLGDNDHSYRPGNQFRGTFWGALKASSSFSFSARLEGLVRGNIHGADPNFAAAVQMRTVPTVFPDLRGGSRIDAGLGINFYVPDGALHGFRLAAEGLVPVYQDLDGPQLETDWQITVGSQYAF